MTNDPYSILGVAPDATDEAIREAYLARLRQFPPDRNPEEFERTRDAYQRIDDPRKRATLVLDAEPDPRLASLLDGPAATRPAAGLDAWLAVIREAIRGR